jgi:hypothetical protein
MEESDVRLEEPKEEEELDASYEYNASGECIGVRLGGDLHLYAREEDRPTDVAARLRRHPSSTKPELTAPPSHQPGPEPSARVLPVDSLLSGMNSAAQPETAALLAEIWRMLDLRDQTARAPEHQDDGDQPGPEPSARVLPVDSLLSSMKIAAQPETAALLAEILRSALSALDLRDQTARAAEHQDDEERGRHFREEEEFRVDLMKKKKKSDDDDEGEKKETKTGGAAEAARGGGGAGGEERDDFFGRIIAAAKKKKKKHEQTPQFTRPFPAFGASSQCDRDNDRWSDNEGPNSSAQTPLSGSYQVPQSVRAPEFKPPTAIGYMSRDALDEFENARLQYEWRVNNANRHGANIMRQTIQQSFPLAFNTFVARCLGYEPTATISDADYLRHLRDWTDQHVRRDLHSILKELRWPSPSSGDPIADFGNFIQLYFEINARYRSELDRFRDKAVTTILLAKIKKGHPTLHAFMDEHLLYKDEEQLLKNTTEFLVAAKALVVDFAAKTRYTGPALTRRTPGSPTREGGDRGRDTGCYNCGGAHLARECSRLSKRDRQRAGEEEQHTEERPRQQQQSSVGRRRLKFPDGFQGGTPATFFSSESTPASVQWLEGGTPATSVSDAGNPTGVQQFGTPMVTPAVEPARVTWQREAATGRLERVHVRRLNLQTSGRLAARDDSDGWYDEAAADATDDNEWSGHDDDHWHGSAEDDLYDDGEWSASEDNKGADHAEHARPGATQVRQDDSWWSDDVDGSLGYHVDDTQ